MNTDFVEYTVLHFFPENLFRYDSYCLHFTETNKQKPQSPEKEVIFLRVYVESITGQELQSKFSFHCYQISSLLMQYS